MLNFINVINHISYILTIFIGWIIYIICVIIISIGGSINKTFSTCTRLRRWLKLDNPNTLRWKHLSPRIAWEDLQQNILFTWDFSPQFSSSSEKKHNEFNIQSHESWKCSFESTYPGTNENIGKFWYHIFPTQFFPRLAIISTKGASSGFTSTMFIANQRESWVSQKRCLSPP